MLGTYWCHLVRNGHQISRGISRQERVHLSRGVVLSQNLLSAGRSRVTQQQQQHIEGIQSSLLRQVSEPYNSIEIARALYMVIFVFLESRRFFHKGSIAHAVLEERALMSAQIVPLFEMTEPR